MLEMEETANKTHDITTIIINNRLQRSGHVDDRQT